MDLKTLTQLSKAFVEICKSQPARTILLNIFNNIKNGYIVNNYATNEIHNTKEILNNIGENWQVLDYEQSAQVLGACELLQHINNELNNTKKEAKAWLL